MEDEQLKAAERLEGMALGQYLAVRAILFAIIATVVVALAAFSVGFIFGFSETSGWPEDPSVLMGGVWIVGGVFALVFLIRSMPAYTEHQAVNRKLLSLQPYTNWADAIELEPTGQTRTGPLRANTAEDIKEWGERVRVAADPASDTQTLERLAGDPVGAVRRAVAANPSTPTRIVEQLVGDSDEGVSRAAAKWQPNRS